MPHAFKKSFGKVLVNRAVRYVERDPVENLPKVARAIDRSTNLPHIKRFCNQAVEAMAVEGNPNRLLILRAFDEIGPEVRRKFISNFVVNAGVVSRDLSKELRKKEGIGVPWAVLLDPTSACNLHCKGCWAAEYDKKDALEFDLMDRIIREGKEIGIFFYIFSGGEPLVRKDELLRLAERHKDCIFLSFTNGTLVDEKFARDLARVGNFGLAFSVEGEGEATDFRRGEGVYGKVMAAMDLMRAAGAPFGFSACYHAKNVDAVADESYLDFLIEKGCLFGWFFTYIPCGKDAQLDLLTPPEKRELMFRRVRDWRKRKPIFLLDFWNDGDYTHGCVAGGKAYFHINAAGDVEPCAFIHYSDLNIRNSSMVDALKSPLFKAYQAGQPFNQNHLRPCPLLDNPKELKRIIGETGAASTQPLDKEDVGELTAKCELAAAAWAPKAAELWQELAPDYERRESVKREEAKTVEELERG